MFRRRPDAPAAAAVAVTVEGREVRVPAGASAAAAMLLAGLTRETAVRGTSRAPYCLMGVCFDCLAQIDGIPNRQSCMVTVAPGMRIARQRGKRAV
ncbi:MAG TPA: 2Fe-2S iron-sulfur cluster-binding protein [Stellaceae bacterium]|nr:2Fe-2S iron-sulfur cluster-binding protein [Stellaceae bacterium]